MQRYARGSVHDFASNDDSKAIYPLLGVYNTMGVAGGVASIRTSWDLYEKGSKWMNEILRLIY